MANWVVKSIPLQANMAQEGQMAHLNIKTLKKYIIYLMLHCFIKNSIIIKIGIKFVLPLNNELK